MAWSAQIQGGEVDVIDNRKPGPPREFIAYALDGGGIQAKWRDQGDPTFGVRTSGGGNHAPLVHHWDLRVCNIQLAGSSQDPQFKNKVLALSHTIATIAASYRGEFKSLTVADPSMRDVYAQVVGTSIDGVTGIPSEPVLVTPLSGPIGNLDNITSPTLTPAQVLDDYGNEFVELNPTFVAPLILGRFWGVELIATGYLGLSVQHSLGNPVTYEGKPAGQFQSGSVLLPDDALAGSTTVYFVSIDRLGRHVDDVTTAPSVVLAGGIHV